jgi:hypothetical protein
VAEASIPTVAPAAQLLLALLLLAAGWSRLTLRGRAS